MSIVSSATLPTGLAAVVRPHRGSLALTGGFATLTPLVQLAEPWPLAVAVDQAIDHRPFTGPLAVLPPMSPGVLVIACALTTLGLAALAGWLDYLMLWRTERTCEQIGADLRQAVFDRATALSLRFHDRTRSGELVSRLTSDVGRVLDAIAAATLVVLADGVTVIGALVVLFVVDPPLALVALVAVPALGMVAVRQRRRVRESQQVARTEAGRLAATATELLRNVRAVQTFSRRRSVERRFDERNADVRRTAQAAAKVEAGWTPRADLVLAVGTALALVVGATRVLNGDLTTGVLVLVLAYVRELYQPVRSLAKLAGTFAKAAASSSRIEEVLASDEQITEGPHPRTAPWPVDEVRLRGVRFGYDPARPVVDGLDLRLPVGRFTAITGPSGTGKSTLLHLLLRLYDVDAGSIHIDEVDIRRCTVASLRSRIAFVPQDPWLLDVTVAENIALGAADASREAVVAAAQAAAVDGPGGFTDDLPDGLDSPVGEGGGLLSGGQQRRVAIARAVVSGAPLLLVDEPTVALDPAAKGAVLRALTNAARGRTLVVVTHDPAVVALADHVVELASPRTTQQTADVPEEVNHDQDDRTDRVAVAPRPWPYPHADPHPHALTSAPTSELTTMLTRR